MTLMRDFGLTFAGFVIGILITNIFYYLILKQKKDANPKQGVKDGK